MLKMLWLRKDFLVTYFGVVGILVTCFFSTSVRCDDNLSSTATDTINSSSSSSSLLCPKSRLWPTPSKYTLHASEDRFTAVSCMAFSEDQRTSEGHPIAWVASGGDQTAIHAVDFVEGKLLVSLQLTNINRGISPDWQSMALGPCSSSVISNTCIYIGNVGNPDAVNCGTTTNCEYGRGVVELYKIMEPSIELILANNKQAQTILDGILPTTNVAAVTLLFNYSHPSFDINRNDAQTVFVDWLGDDKGGLPGDIYIVTRNPNNSKGSKIAKVSATEHQHLSPGDVANIRLKAVGTPHRNLMPIDGAISSKRSIIALRTLDYIYFYPLSTTQTVAEALEQTPCLFAGITPQGLLDETSFHTVTLFGSDPLFVIETSQCYSSSEACEVKSYVYQLKFDGNYEDTDTQFYDTLMSATNWTEISRDQFLDPGWDTTNFLPGGDLADIIDEGGYIKETTKVDRVVALRGNTGIASSFSSKANLNWTPYDMVMVHFWIRFVSGNMDNTAMVDFEGFFLEISSDGGTNWYVAKDWAKGINISDQHIISNNTTTDASGYNFLEQHALLWRIDNNTFTDQTRIRFRSNIKDPSHVIYFADIQIYGAMDKFNYNN